MSLVDFIHVGDYKTGTTWLQNLVFPLNPEVQYLGDRFENEDLQKVLRELVDCRDLDFDATRLRNKFERNFNRDSNKIVGISREALSQSDYISGEHARRNAERLRAVFGQAKIIYVIREQISMLASIYSQYVKTGGTRKFRDWFLDPIECRGIIDRLKYNKNIQMYYDVFGKENVLVLLFEELKHDKASFLRKIYQHIGCRDPDFQPVESEKIVNTSLTTHGALFARFSHRFFRNSYHNFRSSYFFIDKIIYKFSGKRERERRDQLSKNYIIPDYGSLDLRQRILYTINMGAGRKIEKISEHFVTGKKLQVPEDIKEKITPVFVEGNRLLKEEYNLPVDTYGWSL